MMAHTRRTDLRESNGRRSLIIKEVNSVAEAVSLLQEMTVSQPQAS